jgi:hypothetical protein
MLWFRILFSTVIGIVVSLSFFFFVHGDFYFRGIIGLFLGIITGLLFFSPRKLSQIIKETCQCLMEAETVNNSKPKENFAKNFSNWFKRWKVDFFTCNNLLVTLGHGYRFVLAFLITNFFCQNLVQHTFNGFPVLLFTNFCGGVLFIAYAYLLFEDEGRKSFFKDEFAVYKNIPLYVFKLAVFGLIGMGAEIILTCCVPFVAAAILIEIKKNSQWALVTSGVIAGSVVGWKFANLGILPAFSLGVVAGGIFISIPFVLKFFGQEKIDPILPFSLVVKYVK